MTLAEYIDEVHYEKHPEDIPKPEVSMDLDEMIKILTELRDKLDGGDAEIKLFDGSDLYEIDTIEFREDDDAVIITLGEDL